jgi:hypothetical protein
LRGFEGRAGAVGGGKKSLVIRRRLSDSVDPSRQNDIS